MPKLHVYAVTAALTLACSVLAGTLTDRADGFSVTPPVGWVQLQPTPQGVAAVFRAPTTVGVGNVASSVNVVKRDLASAVPLQQYAKESAAQLAQLFKVKLAKPFEGTLAGYPAIAQVFTGTVQGKALVFTRC